MYRSGAEAPSPTLSQTFRAAVVAGFTGAAVALSACSWRASTEGEITTDVPLTGLLLQEEIQAEPQRPKILRYREVR